MTDYTKRTPEELKKLVADKRESLRKFRFGGAGSRSRNTREGRGLRKEIARMLTALGTKHVDSASDTR